VPRCGLDSSGKTTILYKLACGFDMDVPAVPTVGVNVETITVGSNTRVTIWDVGGGHKQKKLWKNYAANEDGGVSGVIFVRAHC
jgi:GTPase SAR1 family protein